jgi:RHS repeat-associated protein
LLSGRPHTARRGSRRRAAWVPARRRHLHEKAPQPYRFAGGYQDPTGLYHLKARYYDPRIGRFTSPDPSGQEKNPYLYAAGDPANRIDPNGTLSLQSFAGEAMDKLGTASDILTIGQIGAQLAEGQYKDATGTTLSLAADKGVHCWLHGPHERSRRRPVCSGRDGGWRAGDRGLRESHKLTTTDCQMAWEDF